MTEEGEIPTPAETPNVDNAVEAVLAEEEARDAVLNQQTEEEREEAVRAQQAAHDALLNQLAAEIAAHRAVVDPAVAAADDYLTAMKKARTDYDQAIGAFVQALETMLQETD